MMSAHSPPTVMPFMVMFLFPTLMKKQRFFASRAFISVVLTSDGYTEASVLNALVSLPEA